MSPNKTKQCVDGYVYIYIYCRIHRGGGGGAGAKNGVGPQNGVGVNNSAVSPGTRYRENWKTLD